MSCKECGSMAINEHLFGRQRGVDTDLCDVHYWMKRAAKPVASGAMSREAFEKAMTANVVMPRHHLVPYLSTMFDRHPTGEYIQGWVDSAWIGWQAATSAQEARVRELEEALRKTEATLSNLVRKIGVLNGFASDSLATACEAGEALSATAREVGNE